MYKILRVLDMAGTYPNPLLVRRLWYKGEDLPEVENPPPQKYTAAHTTSHRILHNAHSSSLGLIIHFKSKVRL
jgi:hypothetical protein